ncbi:MAG TPA: bifunctional nuclease family protein, partial [Mesotoga sp.]|nr:bifunctional nuclease family protein [Mesotoga sp.]
MLQVRLRGLALDQSNSPVVILEVEKTNKGFGIWIGPFEAEALALAVSG